MIDYLKRNPISGLAIAVLAVMVLLGGGVGLGGVTNFDEIDVTDGFKVDGTTVIDGSGNVDAPITTTTITASGATVVSTLTSGGGVTATSTSNAAETLLATDIDTENWVAYTPADGNTSLTLVATSSFPGIDTAGQCRQIIFENASSVAATTTTLVAGAGIDLQETDGGNVVIGGNNYAVVDFCRRSDTDIAAFVTETIPAD